MATTAGRVEAVASNCWCSSFEPLAVRHSPDPSYAVRVLAVPASFACTLRRMTLFHSWPIQTVLTSPAVWPASAACLALDRWPAGSARPSHSQPRAESRSRASWLSWHCTRSRASWLSWHCTQPAGHRAGPHFTDHRRSFTESSRQNTSIRCLLPLAFQRVPPTGVSPCEVPNSFAPLHLHP